MTHALLGGCCLAKGTIECRAQPVQVVQAVRNGAQRLNGA